MLKLRNLHSTKFNKASVTTTTMAFKHLRPPPPLHHLLHTSPSSQTLQDSLQSAIQSKSYHQIPTLLTMTTAPNRNPFSFLSTFSPSHQTQIIDELLQSLLHLRPRSLSHPTLSHLLSHSLNSRHPFPLSLAVLQRTLRSGSSPVHQTLLSLSSAWLHSRKEVPQSVSSLLSGMRYIGYQPDLGTCNYLLASLCAVDQLDESVRILKSMSEAGCEPDSESYGIVIGSMCGLRRTREAIDLVKEMGQGRVVLREGTVVKLVAAMKANREIKGAVEMVGLMEEMGIRVGFQGYEIVVKGCLERKELFLGGKMVIQMVDRGFIPHIRVRQRVVEGLIRIGEWDFACKVRRKLADIKS